MSKSKKQLILVTGGGGYVGSVLVPMLLGEGYGVKVLDNFMYGQTPLLDHCINPNLQIINGDTRNSQLLKEAIKDVDAIFPLACLTGAPICNRFPDEAESIILGAVKNILKVRSKNQIIIYPTTNSGYGVGEDGKYCTEKSPLRPVSLYGRLKVKAEDEILSSGNSISFRLATAFGLSPRMRLDLLVNDFVHRAVRDRFIVLFEPHFKRNYVHVRDISRAFIFAIENFNKMKNEAFNLGLNDANLSKWELCEVIKKHLPEFNFVEAPVGTDPDKRNYIVSNDKILSQGFKLKHSLDLGIEELIKGFKIINNNKYGNI